MSLPITLENFQEVVLDGSKTKLVLVAFWASQVPESIDLRDKLSAAVAIASEQIVMATVDCEQEQAIAQQFGLQSLPTAVMIKDGQPIDGLGGPQTDEAIQAFLDKYLPKEETLLANAKQSLAENDVNQAYQYAFKAYQIAPEHAAITLCLAEVSLQIGKLDEVEKLLSTIKLIDQESEYHSLIAKLELAQQAANSPELQALEEAFASNSENIELIHQLAAQYSQANRFEDALNLLFRQVQKVADDTQSKDLLLDVLKSLPDGDSLATKFRRKLYTLMY